MRRAWEPEDDESLRLSYGREHTKAIATRLCRTMKAVRCRAKAIGLPISRAKTIWSPRELQYLKSHYGKLQHEAIAVAVGRSCDSIRNKAQMLGLCSRMAPVNAWTAGEDLKLRLVFLKVPSAILAKQLGRTEIAVRLRAVKLGVCRHQMGAPSKARYVAILKAECEKDQIPLAVALSKSRSRPVAHARFRAWAQLKELGFSFPGIGAVAGLDHSSILHGTRVLARLKSPISKERMMAGR